MGMNGTTSTAPILACSPACSLMSINDRAIAVQAMAVSNTASGSPTIVTTVRLKSAPMSMSNNETARLSMIG